MLPQNSYSLVNESLCVKQIQAKTPRFGISLDYVLYLLILQSQL